jgi:glycosyltransferase involved in cell wall biosynthesis
VSYPAVSVVMPFLNGERFIGEAIESVLAQSWRNLELILVDDGSTDSSGSVARSYAVADQRVRMVAHPREENRGVAASRNLGVAVALAPRIAFIDADDRWPPWKLTEQMAIMDRHPEIGLLAGATRYWRSWEDGTDTVKLIGAVRDRVIEPPTALLTTYPLGRAEAPAPSSFMLTIEALARVGGFEESFVGRYSFYEDQAFLVKVYLNVNVYFSGRCWLDYRQHRGSALASGLRRGDYVEVRAHFLAWFERHLAGCETADLRILRRVRFARARIRLVGFVHRLGTIFPESLLRLH